MENWMEYANHSISMYLDFGSQYDSDMIKSDSTRVFHLAKLILESK